MNHYRHDNWDSKPLINEALINGERVVYRVCGDEKKKQHTTILNISVHPLLLTITE